MRFKKILPASCRAFAYIGGGIHSGAAKSKTADISALGDPRRDEGLHLGEEFAPIVLDLRVGGDELRRERLRERSQLGAPFPRQLLRERERLDHRRGTLHAWNRRAKRCFARQAQFRQVSSLWRAKHVGACSPDLSDARPCCAAWQDWQCSPCVALRFCAGASARRSDTGCRAPTSPPI